MTASQISLVASMAFIITGLLIFMLFVVPRQFREVIRPKDSLTGLRWRILLLALSCSTATVPPLVYRLIRLLGTDAGFLRNVSTVSSSLSFLAASVLFALIITYRRKE
jgi:hypothetical protein